MTPSLAFHTLPNHSEPWEPGALPLLFPHSDFGDEVTADCCTAVRVVDSSSVMMIKTRSFLFLVRLGNYPHGLHLLPFPDHRV